MFKRAWGIITAGNFTWDEIASEKAPAGRVRKEYVYPWIIFAIILSFVFPALYASQRPLEGGLVSAIITAITLFGGYFASVFVSFAYLKKSKPDLASRNDCETVIAYSYTIIILIEIITTIVPSLFFLRILSIFVAYVIWESCRAVWMLKEEDRGSVVLVFSIAVIFIPVIINRLIHWMLPNA
ncbi:hypothetical protein D0T49_12345 [Paludibacter sp. 221]|nr:hypothetical protein [Paludibacter sp. 221]